MVYEFVEGEVVLAFPVLFKFTEALLVEFEVIVVVEDKSFRILIVVVVVVVLTTMAFRR